MSENLTPEALDELEALLAAAISEGEYAATCRQNGIVDPLVEGGPFHVTARERFETHLSISAKELIAAARERDGLRTEAASLRAKLDGEPCNEDFRRDVFRRADAAGKMMDERDAARKEADALRARLVNAEGERNAYKRDLDAETDGAEALRQKYGARESETFPGFVARLAGAEKERDDLRTQLTSAESEGRAQFDRMKGAIDSLKEGLAGVEKERDDLQVALGLARSDASMEYGCAEELRKERDGLRSALRVSADVIALYADAAAGDHDLPPNAPPLWQVARTMRAALAPPAAVPAPEPPAAEPRPACVAAQGHCNCPTCCDCGGKRGST